jgi:DnaJ-class molecular chaperone
MSFTDGLLTPRPSLLAFTCILSQSAEAKFKEVSEAYAILSDSIERRTYDLTKPWAGSSAAGGGGFAGYGQGGTANSATDDERIREWAAKMGYTVNTTQSEFYKEYNSRPEASTQVSRFTGLL